MPKTLPMVDISAPVYSPVAAGPLDDDAALEIALRLKALADPVRVKFVSLLFGSTVGEECSSNDLAAAVGLTESTVSHHLTQLRRAGLVESERRGMNVYHRARRESLVALCTVLDPNCCR
ncbi:MAG: ArsR family transcriptional regulator, arsenate/arsenite/antimonite-responsive transcriptional [Mycobacterium sp.]|jgi:DNA-binding transcriptional ArsR family regulator|nr:ArsR family transcriptional regulator, arsenate/arsenite/antimonite-responsive transcriptional [Mycobacterium sp.]